MQKSQVLGFRVLEEERAALGAIAREERMNLSEAMRFVIRSVAGQRGLWPPGNNDQKGMTSERAISD